MAIYPLHLLTILVFQLIIFAEGQESETLFQIEDDSQKVEERLIQFIHYRDERERPRQILWKKICKKNVCNRSQKFRKELCRKIIRYEFYGFEEVRGSIGKVFSMKRTFTLKFHTLEHDLCRITMFWCPAVNHLNLETGEEERFPMFFNISRAKEDNALFMYVQQENLADDPIYPRHYLHHINFERIRKLSKKKQGEAAPSVPPVRMNAKCEEESVIRHALEYLDAIKIEYPYLKFAKLFASANVCSIRLAHKIHTCRLALKHQFPNAELDILGYKFPRCRKHSFHFALESHPQSEAQHRGTIYALPCPPLTYKSIVPSRLIISPILHFVSSSLLPDSVFTYSRLNKHQLDLQLKCHLDQMQVAQLWVTDLRRSRLRFYPYPDEGEQPEIYFTEEDYYTDRVSNIDSARGSVKTPSTLEKEQSRADSRAERIAEESGDDSNGDYEPDEDTARSPVAVRSIRVIYNRWFTEYAVLSFHQVREEKQIYQKFMRTHTSLDVCQLTNRQKNELCYEFLSDYGFDADQSPSDEAIDYPCARHEITLSRQEAEYLGRQAFSMWRCLPCTDGRGHELTFYVGKSHLKDAAIGYKLTHFEGIEFIHPDLFVSHVNRYTLADAVLLAVTHRVGGEQAEAGSSRGSGGIGGSVRYGESWLSGGSNRSDSSGRELTVGR